MSVRRLGAAASLCVLTVAGCSAGDSVGTRTDPASSSSTLSSSGAATPTSTASPSTAAAALSTADASPGATGSEAAPTGTAPVTSTRTPTPSGVLRAAVVKEIRAADHGDFDRVVVEFAGTFGRWQVRSVDRVTEDPTDEPVALQGGAFLSVSIDNATFDNLIQAEGGVPHVVYDGPRRIAPALPAVREIADAGDFEAVLGLGIGLARRSGFRAYRLDDPSRLVIDVAH